MKTRKKSESDHGGSRVQTHLGIGFFPSLHFSIHLISLMLLSLFQRKIENHFRDDNKVSKVANTA